MHPTAHTSTGKDHPACRDMNGMLPESIGSCYDLHARTRMHLNMFVRAFTRMRARDMQNRLWDTGFLFGICMYVSKSVYLCMRLNTCKTASGAL